MQGPAPKTRWTLDQRSLDSLLNAFHPDREQASYAYEALRERLVRFFEWNHADTPQELADETLDRLAHRLAANGDEVLDPARFSTGIARLLLKEHWREKDRREAALATMAESCPSHAKMEVEYDHQEERMAALEECLQALPVPSRLLIERYFSAEGRTQAQLRQQLAEEYGISTNALRNRVMRTRMELEKNCKLLLRLKK
jgi:DNA-directed RNA polymerase specialized sigma24 family protein